MATAALAMPAAERVIHVPKGYATIKSAINVAASGDEIIVSPGTYRETDLKRVDGFLDDFV